MFHTSLTMPRLTHLTYCQERDYLREVWQFSGGGVLPALIQ